MAESLRGLKVAILVEKGFEQAEMTKPREALIEACAEVSIISPQKGQVRAWDSTDWGEEFPVDKRLDEARPEDYDALVLPGGVMNPDKLRMQPKAVAFAKAFVDAGKPVAVICHGSWTLIEAGVVAGRQIASWPSLKTDLKNAGAEWVDREVVVDGKLVSSRKPSDIPAFNREMLRVFESARPQTRGAAT